MKGDAIYPTPTCFGLDGGSNSRRAAKRRGTYVSGGGVGMNSCKLSPEWTEWLMGWAIGWTDLEVGNRDLVFLPVEKDPADDGAMGRLTERSDQRVSRIKELGNGQVPLCASAAFDAMLGFLEGIGL